MSGREAVEGQGCAVGGKEEVGRVSMYRASVVFGLFLMGGGILGRDSVMEGEHEEAPLIRRRGGSWELAGRIREALLGKGPLAARSGMSSGPGERMGEAMRASDGGILVPDDPEEWEG